MAIGYSRATLCGVSLLFFGLLLANELMVPGLLRHHQGRMLNSSSENEQPHKPYSSKTIALTAPFLRSFHPRLLVFNGANFEVYNLDHSDTDYMVENWQCGRCGRIVPLLVHALKEWNPTRFEVGQPIFQMLFSVGDSVSSKCVNEEEDCPVKDFAPLLLFGSAPTNPNEMPTVKGFPNWFYLKCIYEYKINGANRCDWAEPVERTVPWDDLVPTITWRGSDFTFLPDHRQFQFSEARSIDLTNVTTQAGATQKLVSHWDQLNPRWRAVALTAQAELDGSNEKEPYWIDTKFTGSFGAEIHKEFLARNVHVSTSKQMSPVEMAHYKYQIDFGGGGGKIVCAKNVGSIFAVNFVCANSSFHNSTGTSWRGTMTKLGFPGVLFHHRTPSRDWFFHEMKPWVHYIPVSWHLGDLRERYLWARNHDAKAKQIADEATKLFENFMRAPYMERVYRELFVDYLSGVAEAYHEPDPKVTWNEIRHEYAERGFAIRKVSTCTDTTCHTIYAGHEKESDSQAIGVVRATTTM